ncbi:MAG: hypothetical protein ACRD1D_05455, partial [Acidimicrobiales bacterium]
MSGDTIDDDRGVSPFVIPSTSRLTLEQAIARVIGHSDAPEFVIEGPRFFNPTLGGSRGLTRGGLSDGQAIPDAPFAS